MREMESFPEDVFVVPSWGSCSAYKNPRLHGAHIRMDFPKDCIKTGNSPVLFMIHSYYSATGGENSLGQLNKP